ncbi:hypothetical protein V0242_25275 (plasmid) [Aeromonas hydrophila]|uniref:hypothetical protein n=1 Tax=Aeromonas hydrophila TaxID=644 RepID=UPI002ED25876|nr:hypothetical protein V0242_25275 [Aeromonas hydrophila]
MENWKEFQALVAIGFNGQFAVIELESADDQALSMVSGDVGDDGFTDCVGIDTEVPGLYLVKAQVNLANADAPEYAGAVQTVVRYTLPGETA